MGWLVGKTFGLIVAWLAWTAGVAILTMLLRTDLGERPALVIALAAETVCVALLSMVLAKDNTGSYNEMSKVAILGMSALMVTVFTGFFGSFGWMLREFVVSSTYRQGMLVVAGAMVALGLLSVLASMLFYALRPLTARGWRLLLGTPPVLAATLWLQRTLWNGYGFTAFVVAAVVIWIIATDTSIRVTLDRRVISDFLWGLINLASMMAMVIGGSVGMLLLLGAVFFLPGAVWWLIAPHTRAGRRDFGEAYHEMMVFTVAGVFLGIPVLYMFWGVIVFAAELALQGFHTLLR